MRWRTWETILRIAGAWRWHVWRVLDSGQLLLCRRFSFLSLFAGLRLEVGDDGRRVHIAAVELALVGEQVLDIVFTDGKRSAGRTTDVQDLGNVLPCLIPSYLDHAALFANLHHEFVKIQRLLGDLGHCSNWISFILVERKQAFEKRPSIWLRTHRIKLHKLVLSSGFPVRVWNGNLGTATKLRWRHVCDWSWRGWRGHHPTRIWSWWVMRMPKWSG